MAIGGGLLAMSLPAQFQLSRGVANDFVSNIVRKIDLHPGHRVGFPGFGFIGQHAVGDFALALGNTRKVIGGITKGNHRIAPDFYFIIDGG